mmetsp:Transcript_56223/g.158455  ORF Transcript_56223/g.158455 Transcript_56223/m.158455 type:complete len:259 (-) Transcript_56223:39-815(-)
MRRGDGRLRQDRQVLRLSALRRRAPRHHHKREGAHRVVPAALHGRCPPEDQGPLLAQQARVGGDLPCAPRRPGVRLRGREAHDRLRPGRPRPEAAARDARGDLPARGEAPLREAGAGRGPLRVLGHRERRRATAADAGRADVPRGGAAQAGHDEPRPLRPLPPAAAALLPAPHDHGGGAARRVPAALRGAQRPRRTPSPPEGRRGQERRRPVRFCRRPRPCMSPPALRAPGDEFGAAAPGSSPGRPDGQASARHPARS